eukprot:CAMPEP_0116880354 /NCGR_PEP_ID=MMETSP0463-20121206/12269_1 /TAXON_ID=181622 /ORGANISM="Strombidinopsis sp, Strain SopsisLIS2011" /LENGTH=47 /DNA_ID= /DNA_START= /DNA_END= /DNA_ORIENTATION=
MEMFENESCASQMDFDGKQKPKAENGENNSETFISVLNNNPRSTGGL